MPIRIEDFIYYRRLDNVADCLTLYRFPVEELPKWHALSKIEEGSDWMEESENGPVLINTLAGQLPPYPQDPDLNDKLNFKQREEAK